MSVGPLEDMAACNRPKMEVGDDVRYSVQQKRGGRGGGGGGHVVVLKVNASQRHVNTAECRMILFFLSPLSLSSQREGEGGNRVLPPPSLSLSLSHSLTVTKSMFYSGARHH